MEGAMNGALLENYAVAEVVKSYQNSGLEPFLYYYRDADAKEIDLLLERDGKLFPVKIKKMTTPPKKLIKVFDLIEKSPLQRGTGAVLSISKNLDFFEKNGFVIPTHHEPVSIIFKDLFFLCCSKTEPTTNKIRKTLKHQGV